MLLEFMRRMLRWTPEERASAKELLTDAWLADARSVAGLKACDSFVPAWSLGSTNMEKELVMC